MANEDNKIGTPIYKRASSTSLDPKFLQRPPSIHSIRSMKREDSYSVPTSPDGTINEENNPDYSFNLISDLDRSEIPSFTVESNVILSEEHEGKGKGNFSQYVTTETKDETFKREDGEEDPLGESLVGISEHGGCIECVKAIPVLSTEEMEEGDHIVFAGAVYDHHGIVVSKCKENNRLGIVEATNSISGATVGLLVGGKARIQYSEKVFNFATDNIRVVFYKNPKFSKEKIVDRAMKFISSDTNGSKFDYHLMANNCEHFATFCVTGKMFSIQVRKCVMIAKLFLSRGFRGISDENLRNEKEFENQIICKQCYKVNKRLLSAKVIPIRSHDDLKPGDVVRYSYWNLWHDAVVLRISQKENTYMLCEIAHYAFRGLISHREIISEDLKIYLDGSVSVVHYDESQYDLFHPEVVVKRAKQRMGEKFFVFFSNDSSHFARWCKLKLTRGTSGETEV